MVSPLPAGMMLPPGAAVMSGPQIALIAVIAGATALMLISNVRRRKEGGPSPRAYAREQLARLKEEKVVHDDLADVMMQLQNVAREINAQLDAKFIRLERSIRDADERIARLERSPGTADRKGSLDVTVADEAVTRSETQVAAPPDRRDSAVPSPAASAPPEAKSTARRAGRPGRSEVFALADEGKTALEIAEGVGLPAGEVELILSLRRTRAAART